MKMTRNLTALCVSLAFSSVALSACDSEVKGPKAEVNEPATITADKKVEDKKVEADKKDDKGAAKAGEAKTVSVNKDASKIEFVGAKITDKHTGGFKDFDGKLMMGADGGLTGVQFTVKMESLYSDSDKLTGHLKNADFFDVAKFPEAKFESTEIKSGSEVKTEDGKAYTHTIKGNMTMHGVTKELTFPAMVDAAGDKVTASTDFVFDRNIFGVSYAGMKDDLIKPEVKLKVTLQAPKG